MNGRRKKLTGVVVSDKMDKTVVVSVRNVKVHRLYRKPIRRNKRFKAHDEGNACRIGDVVLMEESRPVSREKRWRVIEIAERHAPVEMILDEVEQIIKDEGTHFSEAAAGDDAGGDLGASPMGEVTALPGEEPEGQEEEA